MREHDLISRRAVLSGFNVRKVTEYDESGCGIDYNAVPEEVIKKAPSVEHYGNIDISANAVFDIATRENQLRFRETDEMCPRCQRDLEVYYCENRTYIVRCKHCHIVTLVAASNPYEAAEKVGLHVKPVRHGSWIDDGPNWVCSKCGTEFKDEIEFIEGAGNYYMPHYCPHCGAEMDLQEETP